MNIVLVVADDMRWDMLPVLTNVMKLADDSRGMKFNNAHNANSVCCASRASILTGNRSMTTGIYGNSPPVGGYQLFDDSNTIAVRLQNAGYSCGIFGKYMNDYNDLNADYIAPGWERWWAITSRGDEYYGYAVSDQGQLRTYSFDAQDFLTDVIARQVERFIAQAPEPFFAYIVPTAPHKESVPADRHLSPLSPLSGDWRPKSFNEADVSDKAEWMWRRPLLTPEEILDNDLLRANMYRTARSLDDLVAGTVTTLESRGVRERTLIVFVSDNGYMWGEHRLTGKSVPYLEASRMPMVIWNPQGTTPWVTDAMVSNIDLAPTFAALAGVELECDGRDLLSASTSPVSVFNEHHAQGPTPAYATVIRKNWTYTWFGTGEEEFYRLRSDPLQMDNVLGKFGEMHEAMREECRNYLVSLPPGMEDAP